MPVTGAPRMDRAACEARLRSAPVGRIAMRRGRELAIVPVNLRFLDDDLVYLAPPGPLLDAAVMGSRVTVETDGVDADGTPWSVVATGFAEEVTDARDLARAANLELEAWNGRPCDHVVRVRCERVTGEQGVVTLVDLASVERAERTRDPQHRRRAT
ncbi:MAG TPA: pyridoxamine 5'-phosphate oxidase family protein [Acidimicrobiia bacterium]|nr:pyridoxamine 5'-phosphate oxidase family protein [Acidimicrobiia bacterium]